MAANATGALQITLGITVTWNEISDAWDTYIGERVAQEKITNGNTSGISLSLNVRMEQYLGTMPESAVAPSSEPVTENPLISGTTYTFDDQPDTTGLTDGTTYNINFTSNGEEFVGIERGSLIYVKANGDKITAYSDLTGWANEGYKYVTITGGTDLNKVNLAGLVRDNGTAATSATFAKSDLRDLLHTYNGMTSLVFDKITNYDLSTLTLVSELTTGTDIWVYNSSSTNYYILSAGVIAFPADCSELFQQFKSVVGPWQNLSFSSSNTIEATNVVVPGPSPIPGGEQGLDYNADLTSITFNNIDTSNVTTMAGMFTKGGNSYSSGTGLVNLDLSNFNTSNVTDMSNMFANRGILSSLNLSSFNTANVTNMDHMFSSCRNLTSLNLSSFNTANVTDMSDMFQGCSGLTTITVGSGWSTTGVTSSSSMFDNCTQLPNFNSSYTNYGKAYIGNGGYLTSASPLGSEYDNILMPYLTSTISSYNPTSLTFGLTSSYDLSTLTKVKSVAYSGADTINLYQSKTTSTELYILSASTINFPTNCYQMFYNLTTLTSITFANISTANVTNMSYMFRYCSSLTSLNLSSFNTANVTNMRDMFDYCDSLTSLNLSSFNTANVTDMRYMFSVCHSLTSLDISSFNTANVTDMSDMFQNCSSLTTITVGSGWLTTKVTSSSSMFYGCTQLRNYNSSYTDKTRAHTGSGGYLTAA